MKPSTRILPASASSNFLVRIVFLRAMAFVHLVAFWVAYRQNKALIGDMGITPARFVLDQAQARGEVKRNRRLEWRQEMDQKRKEKRTSESTLTLDRAFWTVLQRNWLELVLDRTPALSYIRDNWWYKTDGSGRPLPTLLWLAKDRSRLNPWLDGIAMTGITTSLLILVGGAANVPLILTLWICQRSLMAVGGVWYGYGWEPQLAELSFHALFIVPLLSLQRIPSFPMSPLIVWTIRWYLFRIMTGAGLIKLKAGDDKWKDLTTMFYFYETQPVPNPLSRFFHWMPPLWHKWEVLVNHFVELVAPWLLIVPGLPPQWNRTAGIIQIVFQFLIIASGNLSFLNWLTMVPALVCLDDEFLAPFFSPQMRAAAAANRNAIIPQSRKIVNVLFFLLIAQLSVPVVRNLCSKRQVMNGSFDPLRLVNTYGAFGTVDQVREELIIKASADLEEWREYEFQVKPGDISRSPKFISPYHHRLDWQIWIAKCFRSIERSPWMYMFLLKLLQQDKEVLALLANNPFQNSTEPVKYIRVEKYRYRFQKNTNATTKPSYWHRELIGRFYPRRGIATVASLMDEISATQPWLLDKETFVK